MVGSEYAVSLAMGIQEDDDEGATSETTNWRYGVATATRLVKAYAAIVAPMPTPTHNTISKPELCKTEIPMTTNSMVDLHSLVEQYKGLNTRFTPQSHIQITNHIISMYLNSMQTKLL